MTTQALPHETRTMAAADLTKPKRALSWFGQVVSAVILGQTLFFKFSAHPDSVLLFETLGAEPWGRIASGVAELIAVVLLLVPRTAALGALLAMGIMGGAIGSHLTKLGIEFNNDGGSLFALAVVTFVASAVVVLVRRRELPIIGSAGKTL